MGIRNGIYFHTIYYVTVYETFMFKSLLKKLSEFDGQPQSYEDKFFSNIVGYVDILFAKPNLMEKLGEKKWICGSLQQVTMLINYQAQ